MKYFDELPKSQYPLPDGTSILATDLMVRYTFVDQVLSTPSAFYPYVWGDTDTVQQLAESYYGSVDYAWLVLLSGQIFDWIGELPIGSQYFNEYLSKKYDIPVDDLFTTVHHREDSDGYWVDEFTAGTDVTIYDYEDKLNEAKRNIRLISKKYLPEIRKEFREKLDALRATNSVNFE